MASLLRNSIQLACRGTRAHQWLTIRAPSHSLCTTSVHHGNPTNVAQPSVASTQKEERFEDLLKESGLGSAAGKLVGRRVRGRVLKFKKTYVDVDVGLKFPARVPRAQLPLYVCYPCHVNPHCVVEGRR